MAEHTANVAGGNGLRHGYPSGVGETLPRRTTLLNLVQLVQKHVESDDEIVALAAQLVARGQVVLSGIFAGRKIEVAGLLSLLFCLTQPARAETASERSIHACHLVEIAPQERQQALLARGLERAVIDAPDDPTAHFAVFCFLAKRLRASGVGFQTLGELRRMRRELGMSQNLLNC